MSFTALDNAIRTRCSTEVTTGLALPTQWPNSDFNRPVDALWCRVAILNGDTFQKELGPSGGQRTPGVLAVQVFAPIGRGDGDQLEKADAIAALFKRATHSGVVYRTPRIAKVGRSGQNWQVNVICPFYYDE